MILGITPARGQSKGVSRKNIREVAGKPLIAWTIEAAQRSILIDRYVVSTEDEEIAGIASELGVEVLMRPDEFATDESSTISVLKHALGVIDCDTVVLLQATSPIRHSGLVDECIKEFKSKGYDSLATGFICKYQEYGLAYRRRQDTPGFFCDDGNVYVIKSGQVMVGDRYGKSLGRKIISRWENVDIDDEFDLWLAESILRSGVIK